ncbi:hypothetical protein JVU11DRAFT_1693 [Chiua virens]|nr:hypothetical protein JVU11DRAFT_1693 [Chiua virens]
MSKYFVSLLALVATLSYTVPTMAGVTFQYPRNDTEWKGGEIHHAGWNFTNVTVTISDLYLAWTSLVGLSLYPLARNVTLADLRVQVTIPKDVTPGKFQLFFDAGGTGYYTSDVFAISSS